MTKLAEKMDRDHPAGLLFCKGQDEVDVRDVLAEFRDCGCRNRSGTGDLPARCDAEDFRQGRRPVADARARRVLRTMVRRARLYR